MAGSTVRTQLFVLSCSLALTTALCFRRQRERLIHLLEADEATVRGPAGRRRADPDRMVKSFQRSAAGLRVSERGSLRPPPVLLETADYILRRSVSGLAGSKPRLSKIASS